MLYQKHRPQFLQDVVGHDHLVAEFKNRIKNKNIPQSIYLSGPTGVGKTSFARLLAKALVCEKINGMEADRGAEPCNVCVNCKSINDENFIYSVKELNASNLNIDDIRQLDTDAQRGSIWGETKKVFIINELQELYGNKKAQKNLLAIIENKNEKTHFILTSMDDWRVDRAIIDRCTSYRLRLIEFKPLAELLFSVATTENKLPSDDPVKGVYDTLMDIAKHSGGSARKALQLLERVIEGNLWGNENLQVELGIVNDDSIVNLVNSLLEGGTDWLAYSPAEHLDRIREIFWAMYQKQSSVDLDDFQLAVIPRGVSQSPVWKLVLWLDTLFAIQNWPFKLKDHVSYQLLKICSKMKVQERPVGKPQSQQEPIRRRRVKAISSE